MGIQSRIQSGLHAAGIDPDRLGDAYRTMYLVRDIYPEYDPEERDPKPAEAVYQFQAFKIYGHTKEIDQEHAPSVDMKIIILQNQLSVRPDLNDKVRLGRDTFCIMPQSDGKAFGEDGADAAWTVHLRKI